MGNHQEPCTPLLSALGAVHRGGHLQEEQVGESQGTTVASWRRSQLYVLLPSSLILTKEESKAQSEVGGLTCHIT